MSLDDDTLRRMEDALIEGILSASPEETAADLGDLSIGMDEAVDLMDRMANEAIMTTGHLAQRPQGVVMWSPQPTLAAELHEARVALDVQQMVMEILWEQRPHGRDRLFLGLPECPDVLEMADRIEQLEDLVRTLERRVRLKADAARVSA